MCHHLLWTLPRNMKASPLPATGANSAPVPFTVQKLIDREAVGVYAGFDVPSDRTFRHIALVMGDHFRTFCRASRLFKPPLKYMAEIDANNPQLCRNYFRTLVGIYTAAYKQDNYAIIDKVAKHLTEQIVMYVDLSFIASSCSASQSLAVKSRLKR